METKNDNKSQVNSSDLIIKIIDEIKNDRSDEEIISILVGSKASRKGKSVPQLTFGQKAADAVANFAGSWKFIGIFSLILFMWVIIKLLARQNAFDPYPFILLNLLLSTIAAIQAPMIMMSQNRREEKDREQTENDYRVNLKTEIIIEDLHQKIQELTNIQNELRELQIKVNGSQQ